MLRIGGPRHIGIMEKEEEEEICDIHDYPIVLRRRLLKGETLSFTTAFLVSTAMVARKKAVREGRDGHVAFNAAWNKKLKEDMRTGRFWLITRDQRKNYNEEDYDTTCEYTVYKGN